jgi:hypothetical protein
MSNVTEAIKHILPEVTIDREGVVSLTRKGLCQLLGVQHQNLLGEKVSRKLAESLDAIGFDLSELVFGDKLPDTVLFVIIEHYQHKSPMALDLYRAFAAIGIRKFFQEAKGYQHVVYEGKTTLPGYTTIQEYLDTHNIFLEPNQMAALGLYAAVAYRNLTGKAPLKVMVNGQYKAVANYPVDFMPIIDNALEIGFDN